MAEIQRPLDPTVRLGTIERLLAGRPVACFHGSTDGEYLVLQREDPLFSVSVLSPDGRRRLNVSSDGTVTTEGVHPDIQRVGLILMTASVDQTLARMRVAKRIEDQGVPLILDVFRELEAEAGRPLEDVHADGAMQDLMEAIRNAPPEQPEEG